MIEDMQLRNFSPHTQQAYLRSVERLAKFYKRSPDRITPDDFNAIALANPRVVYDALLGAAAATLLEVAANPKRLGARIGLLSILHTWGQNLSLHPHVHCVVPGGGLSHDGSRWVSCRPGFFLPVRVLSRVFRGKFIDRLRRAHRRRPLRSVEDEAALERLLSASVRREWVVYAKPPFGSPGQVLKYLSRYTHRIAISNRRLVSMDADDGGTVTFRWKDYAHRNAPRLLTLDAGEFLRRFLLHVVPRGFVRIRHYGLLADRHVPPLNLTKKSKSPTAVKSSSRLTLVKDFTSFVPAALPSLFQRSPLREKKRVSPTAARTEDSPVVCARRKDPPAVPSLR
jgi:hypothetical protein